MKKVHLLYAVTLLAAFLLFQIELIIAKIFLPRFGGSYLVWGACMVFFQCTLLAGYAYAHVIIKALGMARYRLWHLAVLLLPLLTFPGRPLPEITSHGNLPLVVDIFLQLAATIGLAFFALATVSIVTQSWLSHSTLPEQRNPYPLYAVSNIGSFLGLLSYPFFFEYHYDLTGQLLFWRFLYFSFLVLYILAMAAIGIADPQPEQPRGFGGALLPRLRRPREETVRQRGYWFLLSAAGCIVFLAVTNVMTYEIAPCPLLWTIPLCLYLASFVLTFRERPLYPGWISRFFPLFLGLNLFLFFFAQTRMIAVLPFMVILSLSLLAICLFCQHGLYLSRPTDKGELTSFYLWVSFGGVAGSLFVTWLAPLLFDSPRELLVGLALIPLALLVKEQAISPDFQSWRLVAYLLLLLGAWPFSSPLPDSSWGIALLLLCLAGIFEGLGRQPAALFLALLCITLLSPWVEPYWTRDGKLLFVHRNYYGIYRILFQQPTLDLYNGTTLHGSEYVDNDLARALEPLTYYHRGTLAGMVLSSGHFPTNRVGMVGLGTGTLSVYGKPGETIDFFELDPDQFMIASHFKYLANAKAQLSFVYGDARLALRAVPAGNYDCLIIDAFSGDSVPVHLLTVEALREYQRCLKYGGVLLLHISNRYLDLTPVLASNTRAVRAALVAHANKMEGPLLKESNWVAITWKPDTYRQLLALVTAEMNAPATGAMASAERRQPPPSGQPTAPAPPPPPNDQRGSHQPVRPWTDDYSHVLTVLNLDTLVPPLSSLNPFAKRP